MTPFSSNDQKLTAFLRQHRPLPPEAKADLEARIFEALENPKPSALPVQQPLRWQWWAVFGAIAFSFITVGTGYLFLRPSLQAANNLAQLEAFVMDSWMGVIDSNTVDASETDWLSLSELTTPSQSSIENSFNER
ncbi:MAG: hypothetical protein ACOC3E_00890 [Cyanobacteriota bacterium]